MEAQLKQDLWSYKGQFLGPTENGCSIKVKLVILKWLVSVNP